MQKKYLLLVLGGIIAAPIVKPAARKLKDKLSDWRELAYDWANSD